MADDTPLAGLRCVELNERGGASYAGKLLRRLGAEVVKAEPPGGDPLRRRFSPRHEADERTTTAAFDYFNDGKESRRVEGGAQLRALVRGADVFVLDVEPRRYEAWGLDAAALSALDCRVVVAMTPFGLSGPYAGFRGSELVASAFGGMSVGIGEPGRPPLKTPMMQTAIQAGLVGAIAAMGVLMDPGEPDGATVVEISETDAWATVHAGTTMVAFLFSNRMRRRAGHRVLGQPYPHQLFRCSDGWIAIQASERRQYDAFIEMVGSPEWAPERRFGSRLTMNFQHADEIDALLAPWFEQRTREEIFAECRARRIPAAPVHSVEEARSDPGLVDGGRFERYAGATGVELTVPAPPFRFRSARLAAPGPVPAEPRADA